MIRRFEQHEATFQELVNKIEARPDIDFLLRNVVFYEDGSRVEPGNEAELRTLMRQLNLYAISAPGPSEWGIYMELRGNNLGLSRAGRHKGYAYLTTLPAPNWIVEDLDEIGYSGLFGSLDVYKPIKGNWHLYLEIRD